MRGGMRGHLHEVLIPGLPELDEIGLDAVHLLVDLPVVGRLLLQVFLQTALAVHDLTDARFQLFVIYHYPEKTYARAIRNVIKTGRSFQPV